MFWAFKDMFVYGVAQVWPGSEGDLDRPRTPKINAPYVQCLGSPVRRRRAVAGMQCIIARAPEIHLQASLGVSTQM